jgi:hypothetical protein
MLPYWWYLFEFVALLEKSEEEIMKCVRESVDDFVWDVVYAWCFPLPKFLMLKS